MESEPSRSDSLDGEPRCVEPISLKHLSAKTAAEVFQSLCSPGGKVVAQEGSNTVLVMDTQDNLPRIIEEIRRADQALAPVAMETVTLRFMDAKNLAIVVTKMLTASGTVAASETGNSLIVCDTPDNLEQVMRAIRKADQAPAQIVVEVVLLDVRLGDDTEIGVNWDYLATAPDKVGYRQNFTGLTDRLSIVSPTAENIDQGIAYNTLGTAGELSIVVGNIRNVVHLIQSKRDASLEVRQAYYNLEEAQQSVKVSTETVSFAEEELRLAEERYRLGGGTMLEQIDAQVSLTQAKTTHIQALYGLLLSQADLMLAIGKD